MLDLLKPLFDLGLNISKHEIVGYDDSKVAAWIVAYDKWSKFHLVCRFCEVLSISLIF